MILTAALLLSLATPARADAPLPPVVDPSAIDATVSPCDDFFQYACGSWLKENPVPPDQSRWYRFDLLDEHTRAILRAILAEAAAEKTQTSPNARKIGDYYSACMDEAAIAAKGLAPLKADLARIDRLKDKRAFAAELARLHGAGAPAMFNFGSVQDYTDASRMIADSDQGGFALPDRDYYLLDDYKDERQAYRGHLEKMFQLLGDKPADASREAETVMRIETALAKAGMGRVERREPKNVHHKMALKDFETTTPSFLWKDYLEGVGAPAFESLDVSDPDFFKGFEGALTAFTTAEWKTYLRWTLVHGNVAMLPAPFVQEDFEFFGKRLGGQQELKARWKRCVALTDQGLGEALGQEYVAREFPPAAKARAKQLVADIEAAMNADIHGLPWMGDKTKELALKKLEGLANKIGYPDKWRDYSALTVAPDDAFGNLERAEAFELHRQLNRIGKPVDRGEWDMTPPTDNAYYDPQMNSINFPAGILQLPNFDLKADTAALLGSIGATVAHELTHGFDDEGRHYDAVGNLADWWTPEDGKAFEARAQGFVDEYSNFVTIKDAKDPAKDVKLNGKLTLGENIADNGGLFLAYMVLDRALAADRGKTIDGMDPVQRFFISYGQSWCENETEASLRKAAKVNPHSNGKWRVNGVVVNMPEFAKAFSCKEGSPMAPGKANRVW
ncbi:MAG: M13 family metallopeptidase [Elusimicrobia bacterium]|nr:M13 family metallopeptidase [Elusimicrobiota bacterium]